MKISLKWLTDYVQPGISAEKLAHRLTMAGMEVEKFSAVRGDAVFELEITPNRPDCLNMIGMAREVSAILNKKLHLPKIKKQLLPKKQCAIQILDKQGCRRYVGIIIQDIASQKTPMWMKERITAIGLRSINNIVDITNFVLFETGQPLHAFDYDKLAGGKIVVRRARQGEKIVTIDDVERELHEDILVIADAEKPVAIAGIMGGKETEVSATTRNILLEGAYFDPVIIRRASRKLGLSSDSSYRFERGVDYAAVSWGARRAAELICLHAKGRITAASDIQIEQTKTKTVNIQIALDDINQCLGSSFSKSACINILRKLGFTVTVNSKGLFAIRAPSFREDVREGVDVIEEVARVVGYDKLPLCLPQVQGVNVPLDQKRATREVLRQMLLSLGLDESITYSLISQQDCVRSHVQHINGIYLHNPLSQDQSLMRPSMLPSLLSVLKFNTNRGQKDIKIFEIGKVYADGQEREKLSCLMTGVNIQDWRKLKKDAITFYDCKGILEKTLQRVGITRTTVEPVALAFFRKDQGVVMKTAKGEIGWIGMIDEGVLNKWDIKTKDVYFAQIDIQAVVDGARRDRHFQMINDYPCIVRDVSISVQKDICYEKIQELVLSIADDFLTDIRFLEEYCGDKIPQGQRGLIFSLTYQSDQRTLREDEVQVVHGRILQALQQRLGAAIR